MSDNDLIRDREMKLEWNRAQNALRHNQLLVRIANDPGPALVAVSGYCVFTGDQWSTDGHPEALLLDGIRLWAAGKPIQSALRFLSASEREFLISGISPEGWKTLDDECKSGDEPGDREPFFPPSL